MKQQVTLAIVLARTNYGEADRIITILTPHDGKVRLLTKGARKVRSKLAGGIELFSVSTIGYLQGKGDMGTLVSSRLHKHFGRIVQDVERTMFAYEVLKIVNRSTEENVAAEYFTLVADALELLDDPNISLVVVRLWFYSSLLKMGGYTPSLKTDPDGHPLTEAKGYTFSFDAMAFRPGQGPFTMQHIKLLRVIFGLKNASSVAKLQDDAAAIADPVLQLTQTLFKQQHGK